MDKGSLASSDINAWISVAPNNEVTVRVINMDMGQGAQSGLAQIVADEMDADWSKVRVEMAPVADAYMVGGSDFSGYYTGGSGSIRRHFDVFRQAGATARAMLIAAAAKRWSVDAAQCVAQNGRVSCPPKKTLSYGELAEAAAQLRVPSGVLLKSRSQWALIGKPVPRLDIADKVNGRAVYGIDVNVDGMLVATLSQCPYFGGRLQSVDEAPARAIKGVLQVVKLENAVAVVAADFWTAKKGLAALAPSWERATDPIVSDEVMFTQLRSQIGAADSNIVVIPEGDGVKERVALAFAAARKLVEADYQLPFLAHAPMEPMNATARASPTSCELWAPMQNQSDMQEALASALNLPKSAVTLHSVKAGGGFGRRLQTDYGVLAARIAKAVGRPLKLIWTREEDFTHDYYRPASVAHMRAALDESMMVRAIEYTGATANDTAIGGMWANYGADLVVHQKNTKLQVPIGAWRSVDASITVFLLESLIDEVAHAVGQDPLAYRRKLLAGKPRELGVLDTVAEMADWGRPPAGRFQGLAYFRSAGWKTSVAEIVELSVDASKNITMHRVFCAIDCGMAVNPDTVAAQTQGGIVLALSAALGEAITLKDGRVEQTNFDTYPVLLLGQAPQIEVRVLETPGAAIGGVGEPPVPAAAPALANALFAATGTRIRTLPFSRNGFTIG